MAPCICSVDLVWPITFIVFVESALQGCTLNHRIFTLLLNFIAAHFKSHSMRPMASHKKILNLHNFLLLSLRKILFFWQRIITIYKLPCLCFCCFRRMMHSLTIFAKNKLHQQFEGIDLNNRGNQNNCYNMCSQHQLRQNTMLKKTTQNQINQQGQGCLMSNNIKASTSYNF